MINKQLDERKKIILEATISNYIKTAEPVGSKALLDSGQFQLSAATIRGELNDLEKDGYLAHLHTSSGRVPTDKGYRLYVDDLMPQHTVPSILAEEMEQKLLLVGSDLEEVVFQVTSILTSLIDYTIIVMTPDVYQDSLKLIQLVLVDLNKILVVILNSIGVNQEFLLNISHAIGQDDLNALSQLLTRKLAGKSLARLDEQVLNELVAELPQFKIVLSQLYVQVQRVSTSFTQNRSVLTKGIAKMLRLPEFKNIEYTQKVLEALEETKVLCSVLSHYLSEGNQQIVIGEEHRVENFKECGLLISPLKMGETSVGMVCVLGPKRMNYPTIAPMLEKITQRVNTYLGAQDVSESPKIIG